MFLSNFSRVIELFNLHQSLTVFQTICPPLQSKVLARFRLTSLSVCVYFRLSLSVRIMPDPKFSDWEEFLGYDKCKALSMAVAATLPLMFVHFLFLSTCFLHNLYPDQKQEAQFLIFPFISKNSCLQLHRYLFSFWCWWKCRMTSLTLTWHRVLWHHQDARSGVRTLSIETSRRHHGDITQPDPRNPSCAPGSSLHPPYPRNPSLQSLHFSLKWININVIIASFCT